MMNMEVNIIAIVLAVVFKMILGFLWYGPLFGAAWMKAVGISAKDIDKAKEGGMGKTYGVMALAALVMAYVLALFVAVFDVNTVPDGALVGFWAWLGFVATTMLSKVLFENRSVKGFVIDSGYELVAMAAMGALFATMR